MNTSASNGNMLNMVAKESSQGNEANQEKTSSTSVEEQFTRPVSPGFGPQGDVTPMLPDVNDSVIEPGFGPEGEVTPTLPDTNGPVIEPGFGPDGDVFPMLPEVDQPVSPGFGPSGDVTPSIPSRPQYPSGNITVIPIIPNLSRISFIRFFNAIPNVGPIDIYVNGSLVASDVNYRSFTTYFRAVAGLYRVVIYRAGMIINPLVVARITIDQNNIYTAAVSGAPNNVNFELIVDQKRTANLNLGYVRFIHLSYNAPAVDIYVDNVLRVANISYEEVSNYVSVQPGRHSIKVTLPGSTLAVVEEPNFVVNRGNFYSAYIVGDLNSRPGLQIITTLEGVSFITN